MKRGVWLLLIMICLFAMAPVASAETRGSIWVQLNAGDLAVTNGAVTLYQVGFKVEDGYRITEEFGGGIVKFEDADSDNLARWLAESAGEKGRTLLLDADGNAVFSELEEGLYMLVQTERMDGFYPVYPVLLSIPQENVWDVQLLREPVPVVTEIPKTGQSPVPFFGVLGMVLSSAGLLMCAGKNRKQ